MDWHQTYCTQWGRMLDQRGRAWNIMEAMGTGIAHNGDGYCTQWGRILAGNEDGYWQATGTDVGGNGDRHHKICSIVYTLRVKTIHRIGLQIITHNRTIF